ncbi:thiamine pyrophosphate-dependent enzyme [Methanosphaerula palustris]|uniref:Indolepyruvate ferredoxin oxidoreductase alpha and beta subunits-like protein n=1 Tax=Methanosphaerula palustris (strain ATCC BAA-1556 / DSM 19958 / E1-9c) TaxID=521011 RepID=B8GDT8_METPE|nr:thiamine pyrophosphate-dependent enzyme [Methanosphaerula palustris]ACL17439.1 indolepyruvate ferredoxin oxidoreductase alpha and beta subunits-like protein [Methanosphaerula palustris E1-9c]
MIGTGTEVLAEAIRVAADRCYAVPGYPITDLARLARAELVINEKVGLEKALGDSLSSRRACMILKHIGLNACADPLIEATTQGLKAGVVVIVGDDPTAVQSQNGQDSRHYRDLAGVPVITLDMKAVSEGIEAAFRASASFSRIVLVRVTPDQLAGEASTGTVCRGQETGSLAPTDRTYFGRMVRAAEQHPQIVAWADRCRTAGTFTDAALPTAPMLPERAVETQQKRGSSTTFCSDCPFHLLFSMLLAGDRQVICDTGCALLAQNPPYSLGWGSYGLGSSIAVASTSTGVALTGDYALFHSGINALIEAYEKRSPLLCIVLQNRCMGMTGRQQIPDLLKYITWADPIIISADDQTGLEDALAETRRPCTLVVQGACIIGETYVSRTMEC